MGIYTDYLPRNNNVTNPGSLVNQAPSIPLPTITPDMMPRSGTIKFIDDINNIYPNDIPSDGSWGVFIVRDFSKVYLMTITLQGIERKEFVIKENIEVKVSDIESMVDEKIKRAISNFRKEIRRNEKYRMNKQTANKED